MDSDGRVMLPALFSEFFRENSGGRLILAKSILDPCLLVYPKRLWEKHYKEILLNLDIRDKAVRYYFRDFVGSATEYAPDYEGRILIPRALCEHSGIHKEVKIIGLINKIEIWSTEKYRIEGRAKKNEFKSEEAIKKLPQCLLL